MYTSFQTAQSLFPLQPQGMAPASPIDAASERCVASSGEAESVEASWAAVASEETRLSWVAPSRDEPASREAALSREASWSGGELASVLAVDVPGSLEQAVARMSDASAESDGRLETLMLEASYMGDVGRNEVSTPRTL